MYYSCFVSVITKNGNSYWSLVQLKKQGRENKTISEILFDACSMLVNKYEIERDSWIMSNSIFLGEDVFPDCITEDI